MATVPLSGTNIRLLSGIPFSNDYKHTRWFDSLTEQTNWFLSQSVVTTISQSNFQRPERKVFVSVNMSIDDLYGTNYIMFQNAAYSDKWFYAFVTHLEYVQRNTTYVHFEIDVLQTWLFDFTFKPSYVVREHCPLWNTDGTPVINTVDEGLNYGTEYDIKGSEFYSLFDGIKFLVIVTKSTLHTEGSTPANTILSTLNGTAQPLSFYFHPFDLFGQSPNLSIDGTPYTLSSIADVLNNIYSQSTAVNNIVSMYITEHVGLHFDYNNVGDPTLVFTSDVLHQIEVVSVGTSINTIYVQSALDYHSNTIDCNSKYTPFGSVTESKLLMHPYSLTIMDDFKGNRITLKNEYIDGANLTVEVMGSMGVSNKVAFIPYNYLNNSSLDAVMQKDIGLQNALIDGTAHDVSIITDLLAAYIQGNKNSLENKRNSIIFNGVADSVGSLIGGIASGMAGNVAGAAAAGVGIVKGAGNSVLELQALQAKQKDIDNMPPQLAKMGSNTSFDYGNGYYGFYLIYKQVKPEYMKKLSDFFNMYGYKLNEVKIPNFHTRQNWNYVQTKTCTIVGSFNNDDLQELKSVFDNGITLWHTDDVGNYSLSNGVIA